MDASNTSFYQNNSFFSISVGEKRRPYRPGQELPQELAELAALIGMVESPACINNMLVKYRKLRDEYME